MGILDVKLDDRRFQDIVDEAKRRIPIHCPEWTDHNVSDPGVTLIELFAWMTDLIIYRLNKVPDKNYLKFLELLGAGLAPALCAKAELTFWLTAGPQNKELVIPEGTEVATLRTETEEAITFMTDRDLAIPPATLGSVLVDNTRTGLKESLPTFNQWMSLRGDTDNDTHNLPVFSKPVVQNEAFYLGFASNIGGCAIRLAIDCETAPIVVLDDIGPPLIWEYWSDSHTATDGWAKCDGADGSNAWLECDTTYGLQRSGEVVLHIPRDAVRKSIDGKYLFWIRGRAANGNERLVLYTLPPRLKGMHCETIGGRVDATNVDRAEGEMIGASNGKPAQTMRVSHFPMMPLSEGETIEVENEDGSGWGKPWTLVESFANSGPDDTHFCCDPAAGEISFGPLVRTRSGQERRYGLIPPPGMRVRITRYRFGGGSSGNVGAGTITKLKSSIPYVAKVENRKPGISGRDPESIDDLKIRGPQLLRTRNRAITAKDYEQLAREASPGFERVECVQPTKSDLGTTGSPLPGVVRVNLVPKLPEFAGRPAPDRDGRILTLQDLRIPDEILSRVVKYLDERRQISTLVEVTTPDYVWVSVHVAIKVGAGQNAESVTRTTKNLLYNFIDPITGGRAGSGWPLGRAMTVSDVYSLLHEVDGLEYVESVQLFRAVDTFDPSSIHARLDGPLSNIPVTRSGLVCSHIHKVTDS